MILKNLGETPLTLFDVHYLSSSDATRVSVQDPNVRQRLAKCAEWFQTHVASGADVYGVTTGFGDASFNTISYGGAEDLQRNLSRYHGCGVGPYLSPEICRAVLLVRLNSHLRGHSASSLELIDAMVELFNSGLSPAIPSRGSVGASGDLTPLSYVAAVLQGERQVYAQGALEPTSQQMAAHGLKPYVLKPKEGLALMNGTSVMSAIAARSWVDAHAIAHWTAALTGLLVEVLEGRASPFDPRPHLAKPHKGQVQMAALIHGLLANAPERLNRRQDTNRQGREGWRLQDVYSVRCTPQVAGPLFDALAWAREILETEINSANDNPLVFADDELVLNAGNFMGSHVAMVADTLRSTLSTVLGLLDRQNALLMDIRLNGLLPDNLVNVQALGDKAALHHGFKAMQITLTSLVAEAIHLSAPVATLSRPTECLNQDVVSLGTIAARRLEDVVELGKRVVAIQAMALVQAYAITPRPVQLNPAAQGLLEGLREGFSGLCEDRALDEEIENMVSILFGIKGEILLETAFDHRKGDAT